MTVVRVSGNVLSSSDMKQCMLGAHVSSASLFSLQKFGYLHLQYTDLQVEGHVWGWGRSSEGRSIFHE